MNQHVYLIPIIVSTAIAVVLSIILAISNISTWKEMIDKGWIQCIIIILVNISLMAYCSYDARKWRNRK